MKADLGGGVKRLMPGTSAFEAPSAVFTGRDSCTKGEVSVFDFSVPTQLYRQNTGLDYNTFDLPAESTPWTKDHGFVTDTVPNRIIDYMYDGNNVSDISFASGFLPLYDGEPEARKEYTSESFRTKGTAKAYHVFLSKNKGKAGDTIKGIGYRKYEDADRYDGKASVYSIPYEDTVYYYVDLLQDSSVSVFAPGASEESLGIVENFGDAVVTVTDGKITVSGQQKDYVVFTVPSGGISVNKASCNVSSGRVSVMINNLSEEAVSVKLVCTGYKYGKMTQVELKDANVESGNNVVIFEGDFSNAEKYTVFMLDENGTLKPLCEPLSEKGLDE
jgi:hypothetical protein